MNITSGHYFICSHSGGISHSCLQRQTGPPSTRSSSDGDGDRGARARAAGLGEADAALPDDHVELVGAAHPDELDVRALREARVRGEGSRRGVQVVSISGR